jgi:hypothetical protein
VDETIDPTPVAEQASAPSAEEVAFWNNPCGEIILPTVK